jgi:hypothetical protein
VPGTNQAGKDQKADTNHQDVRRPLDEETYKCYLENCGKA